MKYYKIKKDRIYLSVAGILIVSNFCLGIRDADISKLFHRYDTADINPVKNPKVYLVSKIAHLFAEWERGRDINIEQKVNDVFKVLNINARLIKNTVKVNKGAFEFLVYINKYNRSFPVRYIPLAEDVNQVVQEERFRLKIKVFSSWRDLPLDRLFA